MTNQRQGAPQDITRRTFMRRVGLTAGIVAGLPVALSRAVPAKATAKGLRPIDENSVGFLRELALATIESARIRPGAFRGDAGPNSTGITLSSPGGNYPALWVRDFAMSLDCGLIPPSEIVPQLRLIARCQNGESERRLTSGAIIPPFAIVDHVNLAGGAVFYPGTYSAGEDQGAAPWGPLPPIDDHFYFIHIAYALWRATADLDFLEVDVVGLSLFERLERAFYAPLADPKTGASVATRDRRAVGFGFQDSVFLLGSMAFATLLRYRAARQLGELCRAKGRGTPAGRYERVAKKIARHLAPVFSDPNGREGWLLAATEVGRQPDVWATLFALHLGVLPKAAAIRARQTIAAAVRKPGHAIEYQGAVRHVPADRFFRPDQCWEAGGSAVNTYQSGAFWHTPTGWLIETLQAIDPGLARQVCERYLDHLKERDFRKAGQQAPWECFGLGLAGAQNPVYMTSVTLPLAILQPLVGGL